MIIVGTIFSIVLESNKIREAGGYNFTASAAAGAPSSFNFGGNGSIVNILQNQKWLFSFSFASRFCI